MADEPNAPPAPSAEAIHSSSGAPPMEPVQQATVSAAQEGERPDWYPEGVNTPEELAAWNKAQDRPAGGDPVEEAPAEEPPAEKTAEELAAEAAEAAKVKDPKEETSEEEHVPDPRTDEEMVTDMNKAGGIYADPDYQPFAIEVARNGDLTPERLQEAADKFAGGKIEFVQEFIKQSKLAASAAAATARSDQMAIDTVNAQAAAELQAIVGGPEGYTKFQEWSKEGLTPAEADAYNKADPATAKILLSSYYERAKQAGFGAPARDLTEEGEISPEGSRGGPKPYATKEEQLADQGSARYRTDAAFRAQVSQRISVTK